MKFRFLLAGLWLAVLAVWVVPLLRPTGHYLGSYAYRDIAIGIPLAFVTLWATIGFFLPRRKRRAFAVASVSVVVPALAMFFVLDVLYALFAVGAWDRDYWLDQGHISRLYNEPHSELGFVRAAGISWRADGKPEYRTDGNGFRNPPGLNEADIVFIGDSYTEASDLKEEDIFVSRVSEMTGLSAANLGRGAYGPQQELIVLERYGFDYSPRFVIWQIFGGNDLADAAHFELWKRDPHGRSTPLFHRYFSNSLTRHWLKDILGLPAVSGPPATLRYRDGGTERVSLRYHDRHVVRPGDPALAATLQSIGEGYRVCRERGIDLLVVFMPTMLRVLAPGIDFDREADRSEYISSGDLQDFERELADFCRRIGCPYINLEPALREAAAVNNLGLFIPSDEHLAVRGHEVVARAIAQWLRPHLQRDAGDVESDGE